MDDPRRAVPRTDAVLADPRLVALAGEHGRPRVKQAVTAALALVRAGSLEPGAAADAALRELAAEPSTARRVINATGVVLHTNLGRAPLSSAARNAVAMSTGYVDVEFDLATGKRAARGRGMLAALRAAVPAAEDALVVNNGAASLVLAVTALATVDSGPHEVIVSRGELVEIGDGFRLPDLIESTGARIREVGTTNRVRRDDYARAVGPDTAAVIKIHPSNFRIEGFTGAVDVRELATLGVPVIADVGSGLLAPHPLLPDEPDATSALAAGASVVTCSGDKLLGGPQAGLALGRAGTIARMRRHPLARALRVDKLTVAALEATLVASGTPTWDALTADAGELERRALLVAEQTGGLAVACDGAVGGGGAPGVTLPGWAVALPEQHAAPLRAGDPAVVGRVEHGRVLLDLRCVPPADDPELVRAVRAATERS